MSDIERAARGRFAAGNGNCWQPGQSGNPRGRPKGVSFAAALARQAAAPIADRDEMAKIARTIGLDPAEAKNIDVVAALFYTVVCRMLLRAAGNSGRADDRLVGMLQVLLRALDPAELRVSGPGGGPIPIAAVVANVQVALGMATADVLDAAAAPAIAEPALSTGDEWLDDATDAPGERHGHGGGERAGNGSECNECNGDARSGGERDGGECDADACDGRVRDGDDRCGAAGSGGVRDGNARDGGARDSNACDGSAFSDGTGERDGTFEAE